MLDADRAYNICALIESVLIMPCAYNAIKVSVYTVYIVFTVYPVFTVYTVLNVFSKYEYQISKFVARGAQCAKCATIERKITRIYYIYL